jgi:hypothetical protein
MTKQSFMYSTLKNISIFLLCASAPSLATAQKLFIEGTIEYSCTLQPSSADGNMGEHTGRYIITVKGQQVRKEFHLDDNNFDNTIILNGDANTAYSLKTTQGKKYAIQLNMNELQQHDEKYSGFRLQDEGNGETMAKLSSQKAKVIYNDGSSVSISYTKEWQPADDHLFEHFPAIAGIPLDYTYTTGNGALIHFHAEKVTPGVVESGAFRLPKDYKIISTSEYQELSKK